MNKLAKTYTLSAVTTGDTGETPWLEGHPNDAGIVVFQLVDGGSWNGTITFYATVDGSTPIAILATPVGSTTGATTATAAGIYRIDAAGVRVRAKATTVAAGSMIVHTGYARG